jgi:hypothetical protein
MKKLKLSVFNGVDCNFVTFELNLTDYNETFTKFGYEKDQPNIRFSVWKILTNLSEVRWRLLLDHRE